MDAGELSWRGLSKSIISLARDFKGAEIERGGRRLKPATMTGGGATGRGRARAIVIAAEIEPSKTFPPVRQIATETPLAASVQRERLYLEQVQKWRWQQSNFLRVSGQFRAAISSSMGTSNELAQSTGVWHKSVASVCGEGREESACLFAYLLSSIQLANEADEQRSRRATFQVAALKRNIERVSALNISEIGAFRLARLSSQSNGCGR